MQSLVAAKWDEIAEQTDWPWGSPGRLDDPDMVAAAQLRSVRLDYQAVGRIQPVTRRSKAVDPNGMPAAITDRLPIKNGELF